MKSLQVRRPWLVTHVCASVLVGLTCTAAGTPGQTSERHPVRLPVPGNDQAWQKLPRAEKGAGRALPAWARVLAPSLPHTTAALLELDYQQRARGPLPPALRARMRWVAAHARGCAYSEACAAADLVRAGGSRDELPYLAGGHGKLPEAERLALEFARKLALAPGKVSDDEVARLLRLYGEERMVAMVLLLAYANFQDRLLLALDLPPEEGGPLAPVEVRFAPPPLGASLAVPRKRPVGRPAPPPAAAVDRDWLALSVPDLQEAMERQRARKPRIRLPAEESDQDIHWGSVCRTYQPELAAAWAACQRAFSAEANLDPVFAASLFWVVARRQQSFY